MKEDETQTRTYRTQYIYARHRVTVYKIYTKGKAAGTQKKFQTYSHTYTLHIRYGLR